MPVARRCVKCNRVPAPEARVIYCDGKNCESICHEGCSKSYIKFKTAKSCCIESFLKALNFSDLSLSETNQTLPSLNMTPETDLDNLVPPPTPPPPALPSNWGNLTSDRRLELMMLKISNTEVIVQNTQVFLHDLSKASNRNSERIREHDKKLLDLENKFEALKVKMFAGGTTELLIDNVPKTLLKSLTQNPGSVAKSPLDQVCEKILHSLRLENVRSDILSITEFKRKGPNQESSASIKVKFKSPTTRDFVLETKRTFGKLDLSDLFQSVTPENLIYLNELTPSPVFKLHMEARRRKKALGLNGAFFIRTSNLYYKNNQTNTIEYILDEDDLNKLT